MELEYDAQTLLINIKRACGMLNTSIYAIETSLGWTKGTIKRWKKIKPSWDKVLAVANFLDISVDFLVGNTDNLHSHKC